MLSNSLSRAPQNHDRDLLFIAESSFVCSGTRILCHAEKSPRFLPNPRYRPFNILILPFASSGLLLHTLFFRENNFSAISSECQPDFLLVLYYAKPLLKIRSIFRISVMRIFVLEQNMYFINKQICKTAQKLSSRKPYIVFIRVA